MWDIEDRIRLKEKAQAFDSEFVELAVDSFARRIHPEWPPMSLSSAAYERATLDRAIFQAYAAHGITIDAASGVLSGGSDPRSDGAAIGY